MEVLHLEDPLQPPAEASRWGALAVDEHGQVTGTDPGLAREPVLGATENGQPLPERLGLESDHGSTAGHGGA